MSYIYANKYRIAIFLTVAAVGSAFLRFRYGFIGFNLGLLFMFGTAFYSMTHEIWHMFSDGPIHYQRKMEHPVLYGLFICLCLFVARAIGMNLR